MKVKWISALAVTIFVVALAVPMLAAQEDTSTQGTNANTGTQTGTTGDTGTMGNQPTTPPTTTPETPGATGSTGTTGGTGETGTMKHHKMGKMSADVVRSVQQALKDKGNDPGPVDGKLGPKTKSALRAFQKANGLPATGRLDSQTKDKLGVQEGTAGTTPGTI